MLFFLLLCVWCCFNRSVGLILGGGVCWVWVVCVAFFCFSVNEGG